MGRRFDIPWVGGQNTMHRGVKIPWIGVDIPSVGVQYTMERGVKIPWVYVSIYHG